MLYSLVDVSLDRLDENKIIRLGDLGSSECRDTAEKVTSSCIKKAGVIFTPDKGVKKLLETVKFEKVT